MSICERPVRELAGVTSPLEGALLSTLLLLTPLILTTTYDVVCSYDHLQMRKPGFRNMK